MKTILLLIFITGLILIIIQFVLLKQKCPRQTIIYRYIPRTLEEEQNEQAYPSEIFRAMFTQKTPWIGEINDIDLNRKEAVNNFFASQV
jgi:hypothetical protein